MLTKKGSNVLGLYVIVCFRYASVLYLSCLDNVINVTIAQ